MISLEETAPHALQIKDTDLDKTLRKLRAAKYPEYVVYLFLCFIFVFTLSNIASIIYANISLRSIGYKGSPRSEREEDGVLHQRRGHVSLRRLPYAAINSVRVAACRVSIPFAPGVQFTFIEVLICTCQLLAILLFEFLNTHNVAGILDPQYWANRAAVLAISQLALILALSGKNNIVSLLTGISYEKLNVFHRAFSRTILILIWVHMFGRWKLGFTGDDSLQWGWVRSGIVANTCLTLVVFLGTRQLRDLAYEFFMASHIIISIIFLVSAGIHVTNARQFLPYVWVACIFWALDRFLRLARALRIRYLTLPAKLVALSADTVGVSLRVSGSSCSSIRLGWRPGQSAYLSVPSVAKWGLGLSTEAHPFTIASISEPTSSAEGHGSMNNADKFQEDYSQLEIKFMIRVRTGFTRRLHEHAVRSGGTCTVSAYVDGPYGNPPAVYTYPNAILIAGGSGVSFTFPLLLDLIRRARNGPPSTICRQVKFVWYIRERVHFDAIAHDLNTIQDNLPANIRVEVNVFVTGTSKSRAEISVPSLRSSMEMHSKAQAQATSGQPSPSERLDPGTPGSEDDKANVGTSRTINHIVRLKHGKPLVVEVLSNEIELCADSAAVCVSGPRSLIDDVRGALRKSSIAGPMAVLRGGPSIFLHVEHFSV
ncbi:FRP1_3 [Sanghuangporus sanghuang]